MARKAELTKDITGMSDEAVKAKTGRDWAQWFKLLDKAGASKMTHKEIAAHVHDELDCPPWWSQMVTVGYERARGQRKKHETVTGFQMSVSRTVAAPVGDVYAAWTDDQSRAQFLGRKKIEIRSGQSNKTLRFGWNGKSSVEVRFVPKGAAKTQVSVDQTRLASEDDVPQMKAYWAKGLDKLKAIVEA